MVTNLIPGGTRWGLKRHAMAENVCFVLDLTLSNDNSLLEVIRQVSQSRAFSHSNLYFLLSSVTEQRL